MTFTTDQVTKGISNCSNTRAFEPDKLSIFHVELADDLEVIYCHPHHETWQGHFSMHFISANLTSLPSSESYGGSHDYHRLPAADEHGFRPGHSTTSALLQLASDFATGFNQRKSPHRTICWLNGGFRYSQPITYCYQNFPREHVDDTLQQT